jgi:RNA polymerase sigma factor (sigma-70 family)
MPPPPPNSVASRLFLGPALRTQPDRRLVSLVRNGYETAFEEIVRRYGKPLGRYAAAIVPSHRAEDVTQDAFSKALLALRDTDKEIELRPWLYRIVRNTALNDLRDQPAVTAELHENIDGVETPPEAAERREEIAELLRRLRALPDPQRAAIVMRELEGLSHEEIAAALGLTGGAARQTIYRARRALRDGAGMLIPVPVLHYLLDPTVGDAVAGAGLGGAAAAGAAGAGASAGGAGAGVAMKAGLATVLVAGSVGTGVALHNSSKDHNSASAAETSAGERGTAGSQSDLTSNSGPGSASDQGQGGPGSSSHGDGSGDNHGGSSGHGSGGDDSDGSDSHGGPGPSSGGGSHSGPDGGGSGGDDSGHHGGGPGPSGGGSGTSGGDSGTSGDGSDGSSGPGGGDSGSGGSGDGGSGGGSGGGDDGSLLPPPLDD